MTHTVTGLHQRKRGGVGVELDGRPWRVLPTDVVVRADLRLGRPLDRQTARRLARELRRARALAQATRLLRASGRSRGELEQHLSRARHSGSAREEAVGALERAGVLDDARLARSRAELLARRGYGDTAIRADLRRRLVPAEHATDAVAALEPELVRIGQLLEGKSVTPALLRRLAGRGFSRDTLDDIAVTFAPEA